MQGFARIPIPVAYRLDFSDSHNDGFRKNSQSKSKTLNISAGTRFADRKHHLSANFFALTSNSGRPGPVTAVDPDDRDKSTSLSGSLSYHLRLDFDNRILARIGYQSLGGKFRNARPAGGETTDTVESLLFNFGEARTRELLGLGLTDLNVILGFLGCTATDPCFGVGDFFTPFGPQLRDRLPDVLDDDIFRSTDSITRTFNAQFRHMVRIGEVDVTYGAEIIRQESRFKSTFNNFDFVGIGSLLDTTLVFEPFALFSTRSETTLLKSDPDAVTVYTQARTKLTDDVWVEGGVFGRYYDDDATEQHSQLDPRLGFGWRIFDKHWLRAGYQRELVLPVPSLGPIAPLAVIGFVAPLTQVLNGSLIKNIQAEWDAEWHDRIFTSVRFEEQSIDGWSSLSSPLFLFSDEARIRTLDFALNVWLFERFGLAAKYVIADPANQAAAAPGDFDLPLIPETSFSVGLNWIHPRQIRTSVGATFVGDRFGDLANTIRLEDYWTTNASINWQPFDKHVFIGFGLVNIFDEDFDFAPGFPAPRQAAVLSIETRF